MLQRFVQKKGFTIVELIVVFVMIGLLAAVAMPSFLQYRQKIRNEVRRAHLQELQIVLEKYYAVHKQYPSTCMAGGFVANTGVGLCANNVNSAQWFYSHPSNTFQRANSGNWIPAVVSGGFYPRALPTDPRANLFPTETDVRCTAATRVTYRYKSTGVHYKLQALCGVEGPVITEADEMYNPASAEATTRSYMVTDVSMRPPVGMTKNAYCASINPATTGALLDVPACW